MEKNLTVNNHSLQSYASDLQAKLQFCKLLLQSAMCPKHFKTEGDVLAAILYGQEVELSPMQALQSVYLVNGTPTLAALAIKAKIISTGAFFEMIQWDSNICKLRCTRGTWTQDFDFTIDEAKKAGLLIKDVWQKYPRDMLHARCIGRVGKHMFADVLKGVQCKEDMLDGAKDDELVLEKAQEPLAIEQKFDTFLYDTKLIKDEEKMMAVQKFCDEQAGSFTHLGAGVYQSIIESKKLEPCRITREQYEGALK